MSQSNPHSLEENRSAVRAVPTYTYKIVEEWPHDSTAYTEGLVFHKGIIYESTGGYGKGESTVRKMPLGSRKMLKKNLQEGDYGEGLTIFGERLVQLTWTSDKGFIYELDKLERIGSFDYEGKRWGLTNDEKFLICSDGTHMLRFLDPVSFEVKQCLPVTDDQDLPLDNLNELEYVKGEIYANIHTTNRIARIDPSSGRLLAWIDVTGLVPKDAEEPNGIAYDEENDRLFVTGKYWPSLFEIGLVLKE